MADLRQFPSPDLSQEFLELASPDSIIEMRQWAAILNFAAPQVKKQVLTVMQSMYMRGRIDATQENAQFLKSLEATL